MLQLFLKLLKNFWMEIEGKGREKRKRIEIKQVIQFRLHDAKGFECSESAMYKMTHSVIVCNTSKNYPLNRVIEVIFKGGRLRHLFYVMKRQE